ncbi:Ig-like domain-containing protein [Streptomyces sp. NBC_01794]|uniref:Ig-like domain-containing protein n=1 Tax=Streptomyces sp. NBC_01794 TaxID=2975942 RepID=UPI00308E78C6|nr:Ig-like domain-containing protein [Streptomyces sp. NBC_01794]
MNAGAGVTLTQTDSYVVGREFYDTKVTVQNNSGGQRAGNIYAAGDCYLQNSDSGYGHVTGTAPACSSTPGAGGRISWAVNIGDSESATYQWSTIFSPTGTAPLAIKASAENPVSEAGANNRYTVTVQNPNTFPSTVSSVSVELPQGFSYRSGTTTGSTTNDPTISGQTLTWQGPFTVAPGAGATISFGVTVSTVPGRYTIDANATSPDTELTGAVDAAPIAVVVAPVITSPTDGSHLKGCRTRVGDDVERKGSSCVLRFAGTGEAGVRITVTEGGYEICSATVSESGEWACTANVASRSGKHTFIAIATDASGNVTTAEPATVTLEPRRHPRKEQPHKSYVKDRTRYARETV